MVETEDFNKMKAMLFAAKIPSEQHGVIMAAIIQAKATNNLASQIGHFNSCIEEFLELARKGTGAQ